MDIIEVQVQRDHIEGLATSKSPVSAIAELIWNALDADANTVDVRLIRNHLAGIDSITVSDDGHGLAHRTASDSFKQLGGSWKRSQSKTAAGRLLHGRHGKGRFQAFALADRVTWATRYTRNDSVYEYRISGRGDNLTRFDLNDEVESRESRTGTDVRLTSITRDLSLLDSPRAQKRLTEEFALYLREYPDVTVNFDGHSLDPSEFESHRAQYPLSVDLSSGQVIDVTLTVIEWTISMERALYLCDEHGFSHSQTQPGIQAPGFNFTAYVSSSFIAELSHSGDLHLQELHPDLRRILGVAKEGLRTHFRSRAAEQAGSLVERWKEEAVYPFEGTPRNPVEEVERQVFDVAASSVHEYLPDFQESSVESRRLSFRLLRTAVETSPEAVQRILRDVLNLPTKRLNEFAQLLERTSLEAMINASKIVADRLEFLQGLDALLFTREGKKNTLERTQLHRIVAENTWIFGEAFNLTADDESLTTVLRRCVDLSDRALLGVEPVKREDGTEGIVDLMFARVVPQSRPENSENLVVELKRPKVAIGPNESTQVKSYATAIAEDDRFRGTATRWEFWAISNEISPSVKMEATQANRPEGLLLDSREHRMRIWVRTWGQLIEASRGRLQFFQEKLQYRATEGTGLEYLREVHEKYLPKIFQQGRD